MRPNVMTLKPFYVLHNAIYMFESCNVKTLMNLGHFSTIWSVTHFWKPEWSFQTTCKFVRMYPKQIILLILYAETEAWNKTQEELVKWSREEKYCYLFPLPSNPTPSFCPQMEVNT